MSKSWISVNQKVSLKITDEDLLSQLRENTIISPEENVVTGWYVDGYLLGPIIEATDEYIVPEFWINVQKSGVILN